MYPSLNALGGSLPPNGLSPGASGGMAINKGFGGQMAAPVNVNAPGGVNAQRGTFTQSPPDGVSVTPPQNQTSLGTNGSYQPGLGGQPLVTANPNPLASMQGLQSLSPDLASHMTPELLAIWQQFMAQNRA